MDPIPIEINIGKGSNCDGRGRICVASAMEMNTSNISAETDALGKAYFDDNGRFVMELNILLTDAISQELADGKFNLEKDFQLSNELLTKMGGAQEAVVLKKGDYTIETMEGNSYRIVF
ncbi:MAG TPA: hypothetical protein ENJ95_06535 [Bacteroidetes bacterium]|nr:hypothetical protein [Bacteroidota bacterium]